MDVRSYYDKTYAWIKAHQEAQVERLTFEFLQVKFGVRKVCLLSDNLIPPEEIAAFDESLFTGKFRQGTLISLSPLPEVRSQLDLGILLEYAEPLDMSVMKKETRYSFQLIETSSDVQYHSELFYQAESLLNFMAKLRAFNSLGAHVNIEFRMDIKTLLPRK